jgi:hypothetical protein
MTHRRRDERESIAPPVRALVGFSINRGVGRFGIAFLWTTKGSAETEKRIIPRMAAFKKNMLRPL